VIGTLVAMEEEGGRGGRKGEGGGGEMHAGKYYSDVNNVGVGWWVREKVLVVGLRLATSIHLPLLLLVPTLPPDGKPSTSFKSLFQS